MSYENSGGGAMDCNTIEYADLSRMAEAPKCAVMCRTPEEAEALFHNFQQQFPEFIKHWDLDDIMNLWGYNDSKTGFTMITSYDNTPEHISYCDEPWFRGEGYEIVEFADLVNVVDIEEGDKPLDFLFGGYA